MRPPGAVRGVAGRRSCGQGGRRRRRHRNVRGMPASAAIARSRGRDEPQRTQLETLREGREQGPGARRWNSAWAGDGAHRYSRGTPASADRSPETAVGDGSTKDAHESKHGEPEMEQCEPGCGTHRRVSVSPASVPMSAVRLTSHTRTRQSICSPAGERVRARTGNAASAGKEGLGRTTRHGAARSAVPHPAPPLDQLSQPVPHGCCPPPSLEPGAVPARLEGESPSASPPPCSRRICGAAASADAFRCANRGAACACGPPSAERRAAAGSGRRAPPPSTRTAAQLWGASSSHVCVLRSLALPASLCQAPPARPRAGHAPQALGWRDDLMRNGGPCGRSSSVADSTRARGSSCEFCCQHFAKVKSLGRKTVKIGDSCRSPGT